MKFSLGQERAKKDHRHENEKLKAENERLKKAVKAFAIRRVSE